MKQVKERPLRVFQQDNSDKFYVVVDGKKKWINGNKFLCPEKQKKKVIQREIIKLKKTSVVKKRIPVVRKFKVKQRRNNLYEQSLRNELERLNTRELSKLLSVIQPKNVDDSEPKDKQEQIKRAFVEIVNRLEDEKQELKNRLAKMAQFSPIVKLINQQ